MAHIAMPAGTPALTRTCRFPGCETFWHSEDTCSAPIGEVALGEKGSLNAELVAYDNEPAHVVVYSFDIGSDDTHARTSDPAELRALAAKFRAFADAIDAGACQLEQPAPRRIAAVGRIIRKGHRTLTVRATPAGVTGSIRTAVTA